MSAVSAVSTALRDELCRVVRVSEVLEPRNGHQAINASLRTQLHGTGKK